MNYDNNELYHYGVPGMKWGVRRNNRLLANHRRNVKVQDAKVSYKKGEISKQEKKSRISEANKTKKADIKTGNREISKSHGKNFKNLKSNIKNQTLEEVPHPTIKKGANTVNKILHGYYAVGSIGAGAGIALSGGFGVIPIAAGAVGAAASIGEGYLIQRGILDKLT